MTVALVLDAKPRDLGGFTVRRALPAVQRRSVGPFVFLDHMGPVTLAPGEGMDVRPHPHIGLSTVSYLFDGAIRHRDSLGSDVVVTPGSIDWMTAGRGIVHSERTPDDLRRTGGRFHGLQLWVALPRADEACAPAFAHHAAAALPEHVEEGLLARVLVGEAFGLASPVVAPSPTLFVDVTLQAGASFEVPVAEERSVYVVSGRVTVSGASFEAGKLVVLGEGASAVCADEPSRVAVLGGAALDGPRHISWNFVSSSVERIHAAEDDWRHGRFPRVPGDDVEFIPLPG